MSKLKKWIIILSIILIFTITILVYIIYKNRGEVIHGIDEAGSDIVYNLNEKIHAVTTKNDFYTVKNCVEKFYTYYSLIYDNEIMTEELNENTNNQENDAESIYNMLDKDYINFKQITEDNILTKLPEIKTNVVININEMYVSEKTNNISIYLVKGVLREKKTGELSDFQIMLKLDLSQRTFTIILQDYIDEKYKGLKVGDELNINIPTQIEKNDYNRYDYIIISEEEHVTNIFNKYKEEILYNVELAYNHLDVEYRTKRFKNIEDFKTYVKNNIKQNVIAKVNKYQKTTTDDYTQYICIDQNGNYYIFRETSVMNYTLILDTYTIDLPEFTEKYNNASEEEKVLLNIQKIFKAINAGDYQYVYNKLDDTFKANYFKTEAELEKYIKEKWYTNNTVSYGNYQKNGEVYVYDIKISNGDVTATETISKRIVMQLKEGTDFVMSFNVE